MRDLGKRLERLEAISGAHVPRHELAVHFVDPECLGAEPTVAEIRGERLARESNELLEDFKRRIFARNPHGTVAVALLFS